nr:nuclear transport factor 2 family protein [Gemmatimonadota bacterium]
AYNGFDVDGMLAVLHPEVEFRNVAGDEVNASASGAEEFRQLAEQSKGLFSSRHQKIIRYRSDGDTAVVDIRYEGVLASDLPNGMQAEKVLRLEGRSEFGFRDGRIDRVTDYS